MEGDITKTVKLYKWGNLQADSGWKVKCGFSMWYCHYDFVDCDEGVEYVLPEGYEVAESPLGEELIYDYTGDYCEFPYLIISLFYIVTLGAWSWLEHDPVCQIKGKKAVQWQP
ncbi:hypothetical protein ACM1RC_25220 [Paenibacillus azoreducens]|uniref:hypothetical protein n=1 Tax=Paenibacillus azoreducens TaxID=116718 RepID=UPI0039F621DB